MVMRRIRRPIGRDRACRRSGRQLRRQGRRRGRRLRRRVQAGRGGERWRCQLRVQRAGRAQPVDRLYDRIPRRRESCSTFFACGIGS